MYLSSLLIISCEKKLKVQPKEKYARFLSLKIFNTIVGINLLHEVN